VIDENSNIHNNHKQKKFQVFIILIIAVQ